MIANPVIPHPAAVPNPFTLNDLRAHSSPAGEPSSTSALTLPGLVLAAVLAIGAFIWLDPLHLFTPSEATPRTPVFAPAAEPTRPTDRQEIIAPLTPVPATKSVEVPIAPAPVVQPLHVVTPVVRPRAGSIKRESRGKPMDTTNTTIPRASPEEKAAPPALLATPEEKAAPPVLLTTPEEKTDAPTVLKLGDDTKYAPLPATTNDQTPATE
jgi:hypothetical protein